MYERIEMAFWSPFGPHAGEEPERILGRKRDEIESNGWTLWSFAGANLKPWRDEIGKWKDGPSDGRSADVYAFLSDSPNAKDPLRTGSDKEVSDLKCYRKAGEDEWRSPPSGVCSPHSFKKSAQRRRASAFIVKSIVDRLDQRPDAHVEWFRKRDEQWCNCLGGRQDRKLLPTRGVYLVRRCSCGVPLRPVRALLVLEAPYLAELRY